MEKVDAAVKGDNIVEGGKRRRLLGDVIRTQ